VCSFVAVLFWCLVEAQPNLIPLPAFFFVRHARAAALLRIRAIAENTFVLLPLLIAKFNFFLL
jgi:hypothetical protein